MSKSIYPPALYFLLKRPIPPLFSKQQKRLHLLETGQKAFESIVLFDILSKN